MRLLCFGCVIRLPKSRWLSLPRRVPPTSGRGVELIRMTCSRTDAAPGPYSRSSSAMPAAASS